MHLYPTQEVWVPYIICLEAGSANSDWEQCAKSQNPPLDTSKIQSCYTGPLGKTLVDEAAYFTNNLNPPHQYTPWIVLQGKPYQGNLVKGVCDAYTGTKPSGCSNPPATSSSSSSSGGSSGGSTGGSSTGGSSGGSSGSYSSAAVVPQGGHNKADRCYPGQA